MGEGRRWIKAKATFGRHRRRRKETEKRDKSFQYPELFPPSFLPPSFLLLFFPLPSLPARQSKSFALCSFRHTGKVHDGGGRSDTFEELANPLFCGKANKCCSRLTKTCRFLSPSYPIGPMRIDPTDEQVVLPPPPPENERERLISSRLTVNHTGKLRAARPPACPIFAISSLSLSFPNWRAMFLPTLTQRALLLYVRPSLHWHCWRHQLRSARSS